MTSGDGTPVVELQGLHKTYEPSPLWLRLLARTTIRRPIRALDGIDLRVHPGEICAVVGPNGAGKTTMFRILTGLTAASGGVSSIVGMDPVRESAAVRAVIGWMPADDSSLFHRMTTWENLWFHGRLHGMGGNELRRAIPRVLEDVGIDAYLESTVLGLSAGMRTRLQLARAIIHRPKLLILDEPTGSIDPVAAHELLGLIQRLVVHHRIAALISSHRLEEIEALPDHVVLLDRGRVLFDGHLDDLRRDREHAVLELTFDSEADAAAAREAIPGFSCDHRGARLVVTLLGDQRPGALLIRLGERVRHLRHVQERPLPLRDLLADLYRDAEADEVLP